MNKETEAEQTNTCDAVVIGGGLTGENVAQYAIENASLTAVLAEDESLGGEYSYHACMPNEAFLVSIGITAVSANLDGLRPAELFVLSLLERCDEWASRYDDAGQACWAEDAGPDIVRGWACLDGERRVAVKAAERGRVLHARRTVVLAIGAQPVIPAAFQGPETWDSRNATGVQEIPQHLIVVGGGAIACEAATWMSALGSDVTMPVRDLRPLSTAGSFASRLIGEALAARSVIAMTDARATAAERSQASDTGLGHIRDDPIMVICVSRTIEADEILVVTGRRPLLTGAGLRTIGLEPGDVLTGRLPSWLYIVGDASGETQLTHIDRYQTRVMGGRIAVLATGCESGPVSESILVPQVAFTDPQFTSSDSAEQRAQALGHNAVTTQVGYTSAAGAALLRDDAHGEVKFVVSRQAGAVLGTTFVGPGAGEPTHVATIAITMDVPVYRLRHTVPAYFTASETWPRLIESLPSKLLHPGR